MWLSDCARWRSDSASWRSHLATLPYGRDNTVYTYTRCVVGLSWCSRIVVGNSPHWDGARQIPRVPLQHDNLTTRRVYIVWSTYTTPTKKTLERSLEFRFSAVYMTMVGPKCQLSAEVFDVMSCCSQQQIFELYIRCTNPSFAYLNFGSHFCQTTKAIPTLSATAVAGLNMLLAQSTVLFESYQKAVLGLSPDIAVKIWFEIECDHIRTLEYINKHAPDVPTLTVYGFLKTHSLTYLFMTRIDGASLDTLWPALDEAQKKSVRDQLTSIFKSLRAIPGPPLEDGKPTLGGGCLRRC
jgi:hypothetical protein